MAGELGWVPNGSARGLAERRVGIVGVLFPDLGKDEAAENESPLFVDQVIRGAERSATLAGDAVLIAATEGANGRALARSVAGKVDGLVVTARSLSAADLAAVARSLPVVVLDAGAARRNYDAVLADNRGGAFDVTEPPGQRSCLSRPGLRCRAGPITGLGPAVRRLPRSAARRPAWTSPARPDALGNFTEAGGARARATRCCSSRARPPRAIVFGNDEMALGGLDVLRDAQAAGAGQMWPSPASTTSPRPGTSGPA